jgi:transposase InsO family protein
MQREHRSGLVLNVVDDFTRECVEIDVGRSIPGVRVVRVLERLRARDCRRRSSSITGPEFAGRVLDTGAYGAGVQLQFIRPGNRSKMPSSKVSTQVPRRVPQRY